MSPKHPTPPVGVRAPSASSPPVPGDSGDLEPINALEEAQALAVAEARAAMPVEQRLEDVERRMLEGARRMARLRDTDERLETELRAFRDEVMPRATPARMLRMAGWIAGAAAAIVGWVLAANEFARRTELREVERREIEERRILDGRVRAAEAALSELRGMLRVTPTAPRAP
jgi:hypothetical protein